MFDQTTQILLIVVVSSLTLLLIVIGAQVFLILKEVRHSLKRVNQMLENFASVSESIAQPLMAFSETVSNLSGIGGLINLFLKRGKKEEEE